MRRFVSLIILLAAAGSIADAFTILYKEQFYRLYHQQLYRTPLRSAENIFFLEQALRADFANPLNALAVIKNETEWERYRHLFVMQINLKLIEEYLAWGRQYDKMSAYFFNFPWRTENLNSLKKAESLYEFAKVYWREAKEASARAWRLRRIHLAEVQHWADQNYRIETGDLDYERIINRHLSRLRSVRERFEAMDESTY